MNVVDNPLLLNNIVNTMNDGLFVVSPEGRIVMVNDALASMLGYSRAELLGKPCTFLKCDVCARSRKAGGERWCRLFDKGAESRKRCTIEARDGRPLSVLKNASILTEDGRVLGAVETVTDVTELCRREETIRELRKILDSEDSFAGMIGRSAPMRRTFELLEKAARSEAPVIILGESGTGKELAARALHELGPRKDGPFIQLNCAALNESLLESELFGHAKGAFTGAYRHREGRFEAAGGGDFFLDEIGDVPLATQVKLLRVLETKTFERVGEHTPIETDVRIITATNRDLASMVARGEFREDLYFRINVIPIHLPPLRERADDIAPLTDVFVKRLRTTSGRDIQGLSPESMQLFMAHSWPGNVRELKSALEYAFVIAESGLITPEHLPPSITGQSVCGPASASGVSPTGGRSGPQDGPEEKRALIEALTAAGGNKSEAARILGVNRVTVLNRMRKYGVELQKIVSG